MRIHHLAIFIALTTGAACGSSHSSERRAQPERTMPERTTETTPAPTPEPIAPTPPPVPARTPYTDAEIMAITAAVDNGEIELAKLARPKAKAKAVKDFASMMITHHSAALKRGQTLARKLEVTPMQHPKVDELTNEVANVKLDLGDKQGAVLDEAYIDSQITMHQQVLAMIDDELLKDATAEPLRAELTAMRVIVTGHIEAAQKVKGGLAATP